MRRPRRSAGLHSRDQAGASPLAVARSHALFPTRRTAAVHRGQRSAQAALARSSDRHGTPQRGRLDPRAPLVAREDAHGADPEPGDRPAPLRSDRNAASRQSHRRQCRRHARCASPCDAADAEGGRGAARLAAPALEAPLCQRADRRLEQRLSPGRRNDAELRAKAWSIRARTEREPAHHAIAPHRRSQPRNPEGCARRCAALSVDGRGRQSLFRSSRPCRFHRGDRGLREHGLRSREHRKTRLRRRRFPAARRNSRRSTSA